MEKQLRLSLIFRAAGNAKAFLGGLSGESKRTADALNGARTRLNDLQRTARDVSSFKASETRLAQLRVELEAARTEARRLAQAHEATTTPTKAMTRAFEVAKTRLEELKTKEVGQVQALAQLENKLRAAGVSTNALGAHERGLARDIDRANDELAEQARRMDQVADRQRRMNAARGRYDRTQQLAGTMQGAGTSAVAAGAAAAAPVVLASQRAMSFEDGMADVKKVVDFDTPEQFRAMSADVLNLSTRLPVAVEGLTQIVAAAGQAGIARGELLGFAEDAGKMGVAFDTTADDAGAKMAGWRTAFAMTQPQVRALADQINYLGNTGPANALAISNVVTRIGPLGEVAGLAAGQIAALGSTVVGMGVQEEVAATGIKNMMLALTSGEAATKAQRGAFKALGLDATEMARRMQTDAGGAITDVMGRMAGLSEDRQSAVLKQLFGSESIAAIAPLLTNLDLLKTNLGKVGNETLYAGSMQREFEARAATTSNAVQLAKQGLNAVAVEIGTNFLPAIQAGSRFLGQMTSGIRAFSVEHPGAVKAAGMLLAIVAGGLIVFGGLAMAVAAVLGPFALLQLTLTQTAILFGPLGASIRGVASGALPLLGRGLAIARTAMLGFNLALLANPITWIIVGVVALAAAAFLIYRNWGRIGPWLSGLWSGLVGAVKTGLAGIGRALLTFSPLGIIIRNWRPITNFLGAVWQAAGAVVGLGMDYLKLAILSFTPLGFIIRNWGAISGALAAIWSSAKAVVAAGVQAAIGFVMNYTPMGAIARNWGAIGGFIGGVWTSARAAVASGIEAIRSAIAGFGPLQAFQQAFASVWTWLGQLPSRMMNAGADVIRGFTAGINGQRAQVQAATANIARVPESTTRRETRTRSPSRVMMAVGRDVMAGFSVGLGQMGADPARRMRRAAAGVVAAAGITLPAIAAAEVGLPVALEPAARSAPAGSGQVAPFLAGEGGTSPTPSSPASGPVAAPSLTSLLSGLVNGMAAQARQAASAAVGGLLGGSAGAKVQPAVNAMLAGPLAGLTNIVRAASAGPSVSGSPQGVARGVGALQPNFHRASLPEFESGSRLSPAAPPAPLAGPAPVPAAGPTIGSVTFQISQQPGESETALVDRIMERLRSVNLAELGDQGFDSFGETL